MSIEFTILCTQSPEPFLDKPVKGLKWNATKQSGKFGTMGLRLRDLRDYDELPDPTWAPRVVAVIHAEGHLNDRIYDAFDEWMRALAKETHGAIYSPMRGKFVFVWSDVDEAAKQNPD
jgi:hypothetical protein